MMKIYAKVSVMLSLMRLPTSAFLTSIQRNTQSIILSSGRTFQTLSTSRKAPAYLQNPLVSSTTSVSHLKHVKSKIFMSTSTASTISSPLNGISWLQDCTIQVLNDTFDSTEYARVTALTKLEPKKKKKKKKKKRTEDESSAELKEPPLTQQEKEAIADAAAASAVPFGVKDAMITPATKMDFGDYQCNAAMGLAKNLGMSPRECATKIIDGLRPLIESVFEEPEIAGPGFINLRFKQEYLTQSIRKMAADSDRLGVPPAM